MGSIYATILIFCLTGSAASGYSQKIATPHQYIAYKTVDSITIDGRPNEDSWTKAIWTTDFIDIEGEEVPPYQTRLKMLYDADYLYVYAEMEEPQVWATLKQRDTVIFYNNDFEVFIDPDGDTHNYMEFEVNALNTVWDLFLTKPYRNSGTVLDNWDIEGLKSAVAIDGTLNDPSDVDKGWSVEMAFPWKALGEIDVLDVPPVDRFWRINFSRVNWDYELKDGRYARKKDPTEKFLPEYNWVWSPQQVINMHEPERWGYVYFSPKRVGEKSDFKLPDDEGIKWALYKIYRKEREDLDQNPVSASAIETKNLDPIQVGGKMMIPIWERYQAGWNLSVVSPFSGKMLLIKDDGQFIEMPRD